MLRRRMFPLIPLALAALAAFAALTDASAASMDVTLNFASLPSAQGFTYTPTGAHAAVLEPNVFSVSGGVLTQNTMGQSNGISGGGILYQINGGMTATETKQIRVRTRCLQVEGSAGAPSGEGGLVFGFSIGSVQYAWTLTPTKILVLQSTSYVAIPGVYDNTVFHDYTFEFIPPTTYRTWRDGGLINTSTVGYGIVANRLFIGDGTGGANARGEITSFRFIQDIATATRSSSWGRIKGLYR